MPRGGGWTGAVRHAKWTRNGSRTSADTIKMWENFLLLRRRGRSSQKREPYYYLFALQRPQARNYRARPRRRRRVTGRLIDNKGWEKRKREGPLTTRASSDPVPALHLSLLLLLPLFVQQHIIPRISRLLTFSPSDSDQTSIPTILSRTGSVGSSLFLLHGRGYSAFRYWRRKMAALQLRGARVSVEGGRGENLRCSSSSSYHSMGSSKLKSSYFVSFRPKPTHGHRCARGTDLTVVMTAQSPANPMSFPTVAACLEPLFQGHHHPIIAADNKKNKKKTRWEEKEPVSPEKLEQWMRDSVGEIVRNIGEAPFLVQIFSCGVGGVRLEREAASQARWLHIRRRWDKGSPRPDGVILVEELRYEEEDRAASAPSTTRTWGLVVQGRGMDRAACYILNTSRVRSSAGFCTHFCMVRAKCSGEPWELQLRKAWLWGR